MSEPHQLSYLSNAHAEDSEDDIEVLVFKNSRRTNNTIDTTSVGTNNEQNNNSTVHADMKRKPLQNLVAAEEDRMACAGSHEMHDHHNGCANENSIKSLLRGPLRVTNDNISEAPESKSMDETNNTFVDELNEFMNETSTSTAQPPITTITTTNHTTTSKIARSNPSSHIKLFKTLSPSQKTGRRTKLRSIKQKLKEKTVDQLTDLYNRTEDPGFRVLMSKVYYENCMARLDDWEKKL